MEDWIKSHLRERAIISIVLVVGGVLSLVAGGVLVAQGIADESVWFEGGGYKITAKGFGAITLLSGAVWGLLAFLSRPEVNFRDRDQAFSLTGGFERRPALSPGIAAAIGALAGLLAGVVLGVVIK